MNKLIAAMHTSEFWVALATALLAVLEAHGLADSSLAQTGGVAGAVYAVARILSKVLKALPTNPSNGGSNA